MGRVDSALFIRVCVDRVLSSRNVVNTGFLKRAEWEGLLETTLACLIARGDLILISLLQAAFVILWPQFIAVPVSFCKGEGLKSLHKKGTAALTKCRAQITAWV